MKKFIFAILFILNFTGFAEAQTSRHIQSSDITGALGYTPIQSLGGMTGVITCGAGLACSAQTVTLSTFPVTSLSGLGTGVSTALGVNIGSAGAFTVNGGALGTPTSGVATNLTGTAAGLTAGAASTAPVGGIIGAGTGCITWLTTPSSVNLRGCLTDETGTGFLYFQGGDIGTPSAGIATNLTGTAAGLTAGAVTTNANLTGPVTSVGNATTIGANQVSRANLAQGIARSIVGVAGNATANVADIQGTANQALVVNSAGTALAFGTVANAGLTNSSTTVAGATCTLGSTCGLSSLSNALGADVLLNNTATFFDGPTVAQGTTGTWFVSTTITFTTVGTDVIMCKLWDGTTIISSSETVIPSTSTIGTMTLSGILASPAANIKISCKDTTNTTGKIVFNTTGIGKDSSLYVFRIN